MSAQENLGKPPPRWLLKLYTRINVWVYRWSKGKYLNRLQGKPICLVTMKGAKSARERTVPLMYVPYENGFVLVASQGGTPKNPVWYYNLKKYPQVTIEYNGVSYSMLARQVTGEEKARIWPTCLAYWPDYAIYQQRTGRDIPVFLCEPR
jgi:deazaflavin-dependent oxidoreductase (nitroreductase family)